MILRTKSEDVMTATVIGILKNLTPKKWLGHWLNESFQSEAFSDSQFNDLTFKLWTTLAPPAGLKQREGNSHPDLVISFDDKIIACEVKFTSPLSGGTSHSSKRNQLLRYIDVFADHFNAGQLFRKQVFVLTLTLEVPDLIKRYQSRELIARDLEDQGYSREYAEASAKAVNVGASTWRSLAILLTSRLEAFSVNPVEEAFVLDCIAYIWTKIGQAEAGTPT
jgi:hypothetical protein